MSQVSTTFPDSTYTSSNKPSADTLKTDIAALETAHNDTDTNAVLKDGSVAFTGNVVQGATPSAATHLATLGAIYPVGSIYINAAVDTNPATLLGFGTWTAFGAGKVPVGKNAADADFDTLEETGGAKTHTLTTDEIPSHQHVVTENNNRYVFDGATGGTIYNTVSPSAIGIDLNDENTGATGGGSAHNNVQPYIVVNMWKRAS